MRSLIKAGRHRPHVNVRSQRTTAPGTLLGSKMTSCFRCKREFPEETMSSRPRGAQPGQSRFLICKSCVSTEER